jgi:hypothetical protein
VDLIKTFLFEGALRRLACCFLFLSTEERYNTEIWFQGEVESVSEGLVAEYIKKENELKREKQFYSENKKNLVEKIIRAHCCGFFHDIDQLAKQFYHSIDENLSVKRVARKE